jgi:hypothetical protein
MNNHFVYIYYDENNIPFYVGLGQGARHLDHIKYAKTAVRAGVPRNKLSHKLNKIIKMLSNNIVPRIEFAYTNVSVRDARLYETALILQHGRVDLGTGTLTNLTNGGDGVVGRTTMIAPDGSSVSILKEDKPAYEEMGYIHFNKNRKHSDEVNKRKAGPWTGGTRPEHGNKIKKAAQEGAYKNRSSRGSHSEKTLEKMRAPKKKRAGYQGRKWYHSTTLKQEACINSQPNWPDVQPGRLPKKLPV